MFSIKENASYDAIKAAYLANGATLSEPTGQVPNVDGNLMLGDTINFPDEIQWLKMKIGIRSNMSAAEIAKLNEVSFFLIEVIRSEENGGDKVIIPFYPSSLTRPNNVFDVDDEDQVIPSTRQRVKAKGSVSEAYRKEALLPITEAAKKVFAGKTAKVTDMLTKTTYGYGSTTQYKTVNIPTIEYVNA